MRTHFTHQVKATDSHGNQCSFQVSTDNPAPVNNNKIVIMYVTRKGLLIDEAITTSNTATQK